MSFPRHAGAILSAAVLLLVSVCGDGAHADTFGSGVNAFDIDFVAIGEPGNPRNYRESPAVGPIGSVPYVYRMGKYEIATEMILKANAATAGSANPLQITIDPRGPLEPATSVSWFEAAKFVNWLNTSSGHSPAYKFERPPGTTTDQFALWTPSDPGFDPANQYRNSQAFYFLTSENEWYKAAYYRPGTGNYHRYPTGDTVPTPVAGGTEDKTAVYRQPGSVGPAEIMNAGGLSAFGTMAQGGNVMEWLETSATRVNNDPLGPRRARRNLGEHFVRLVLER